jgi:SAM-dependent methyltransferase
MPGPQELSAYYSEKYYQMIKNNHSMSDKLNDPDGFYNLQYRDRLAVIEQFVPALSSRTILDIGAGYGDFLRFMGRNAWSTQGFEISKDAYFLTRDRKKLGILQGNITDIENTDFKRVSVVTLNNVLEHLSEPMRLLALIRERFLSKDGVVAVIVPNDFSPLQDALMKTVLRNRPKNKYYWLAPPEHLNYWSIAMFGKFVNKCGFRVLSVTADFPMEFFPLMGHNYITDPQEGRKAHMKRVSLERNFYKAGFQGLKMDFFKSLAALGMGRDAQFILKPYSRFLYKNGKKR